MYSAFNYNTFIINWLVFIQFMLYCILINYNSNDNYFLNYVIIMEISFISINFLDYNMLTFINSTIKHMWVIIIKHYQAKQFLVIYLNFFNRID